VAHSKFIPYHSRWGLKTKVRASTAGLIDATCAPA